MRRLFALVGCVGLIVGFSGPALAATAPLITPTRTTFKVPAGSTSMWTLRLWSQGTLEGSDTAASGTLAVAVPHTADCTFQADVIVTPVGGSSHFYSGSRATFTSCGGTPPPTQTIAGHIFLCTPGGTPTTTEVAGGALSATGAQTVTSQANPLRPTAVASGNYIMTADAPTGYLLVACGGPATAGSTGLTATESITVPSGGAVIGLFYASAPPSSAGGGTSPSNPVVGVTSSPGHSGAPQTPIPVATATGDSPPVAPVSVPGSALAFTGMNAGPPLLLGLVLLGLGTLMIFASRSRRSARPVTVAVRPPSSTADGPLS
jgi:hypothetical protein